MAANVKSELPPSIDYTENHVISVNKTTEMNEVRNDNFDLHVGVVVFCAGPISRSCLCACDRDDIWTTPASAAGRAGPSGSLSSSVGKIGSDDEMSLNDYASLTPGKFTEDGSFIGQYNPAMKWKSSQSQPPPAYQSHHA